MHWLRAPALGAAMGFAVAVAVVLTGPDATAKTSYDSGYGYERTWNAGIRLIRVDMNLKVTETSPPMKGATASGGPKPATLENGLTIKVPQFVKAGDVVRVDTGTNEYVDRAG